MAIESTGPEKSVRRRQDKRSRDMTTGKQEGDGILRLTMGGILRS